MRLKKGNTNYEKVAEIDGRVLFTDSIDYFLFEHYPAPNGGYCAVPVLLGKTKEEVRQALNDLLDWNYRAWHGEMADILAISAAFDALDLPDLSKKQTDRRLFRRKGEQHEKLNF